jgi:hypothetical protein
VTALPVPFGWETAAVAAFAALVAMAAVRSSSLWRRWLLRLTVAAVAVAATAGAFRLVDEREEAVALRAWSTRVTALAERSLAPDTALPCLDGEAGETVEAACEKAIFATPQSTATAVSYVATRLTLLAEGVALTDDTRSVSLAGLRRAIALDRYGIAAHVLATRDGCTTETCPAFALVADPAVLKANLKANAFDAYVQRYAALWNKPEQPAKPAAPADAPQANAGPVEPPAIHPSFSSRWDFPSSDSIPAVSIMNKEPPRPPEPDAKPPPAEAQTSQAAPAPTPPHTPVPPKRPQTQGAAPR